MQLDVLWTVNESDASMTTVSTTWLLGSFGSAVQIQEELFLLRCRGCRQEGNILPLVGCHAVWGLTKSFNLEAKKV